MKGTEKLYQRAHEIQSKAHSFTKDIVSRTENPDYQSAHDVYIYLKIAELEIAVEQLKVKANGK